MELAEPIEQINKRLVDLFGIDSITGLPIWRVSWSEDQLEKRYGTFEDYSGDIYLRTVTEVREVKKYGAWIKDKYVLERLTVIPQINAHELPGSRISYEPMWVFEDAKGNYLPPKTNACKLIIDTVHAATSDNPQGSMRKYVDELANETPEMKDMRIQELVDDLWGNDNDTHLALRLGEGVVVPRNYGDEK